MEKKTCLPGAYLASCEEFVPGDNTYVENDNIYAAVMGEVLEDNRKVSVISEKSIPQVKEGTKVCCRVVMMKESKAIMECTLAESKGRKLSTPIIAALPIQNVKRGYVKNLTDEMRIGDIVRAVITATKPAVDISTSGDGLGVLVAHCKNCRKVLDLKEGKLHCSNCGRIDNRHITSDYRGNNYGSENIKHG